MSSPPAGNASGAPGPDWYPDPSIPGYIRYWNGTSWVPGSSRPEPREGEPRPAPPLDPEASQGPNALDGAPQRDAVAGSGPVPELPGGRGEPAADASTASASASGSDSGSAAEPEAEHGSGLPELRRRGDVAPTADQRVTWGSDEDVSTSPVAAAGRVDPRGQFQLGPSEGPRSAAPEAGAAGVPEPRKPEPAQEPSPSAPAGQEAERAETRPAQPEPTSEPTSGPTSEPAPAPAPERTPDPTPADRSAEPDAREQTVGLRLADIQGGAPWRKQGHDLAQPPQSPPQQPSQQPAQQQGAAAAAPPALKPPERQAPPAQPQPQQPPGGAAPQGPQPGPGGYGYPGPGAPGAAPAVPGQGGYGYPGPAAPGAAPGAAPAVPGQGGYGYPGPAAPGAAPHAAPPAPAAPEPVRAAAADSPFVQPDMLTAQITMRRGDPAFAAAGNVYPAKLGRRLLARIIDSLLPVGGALLVGWPLLDKARDHIQEQIDAAEHAGVTRDIWLIDGTTGGYLAMVLGVFLGVGLLLEALPTAFWGRSLGKAAVRLRVLDVERQSGPSFGAALLRWLVYSVLGVLVIGIVNVLWCLRDRPWRQCWHDKAAGTFVAGG